MSGYMLGQPVAMSGTVQKVRDQTTWRPKDGVHIYREAQKDWASIKEEPGRNEYGTLRTRLIEFPPPVKTEGVIVGKRTMFQGITESFYDEGSTFLPCESNQVWLVAYDLRRKPALCFDHQLTELTTEKEGTS